MTPPASHELFLFPNPILHSCCPVDFPTVFKKIKPKARHSGTSCNPTTREAESGEWQVGRQVWETERGKTLFQNKKQYTEFGTLIKVRRRNYIFSREMLVQPPFLLYILCSGVQASLCYCCLQFLSPLYIYIHIVTCCTSSDWHSLYALTVLTGSILYCFHLLQG